MPFRLVAPRAGAWIEISIFPSLIVIALVAPRAGAWIEMLSPTCTITRKGGSLPVRERGLKFFHDPASLHCLSVAPRAGAWIEIGARVKSGTAEASLPVRERGLKLRSV